MVTTFRRVLPALTLATLLMTAGIGGARWWRASAVVGDHMTETTASIEMALGGPSTLAQWVLPTRDGLSAVDVVVTAEDADLPGDLIVRIEAITAGVAKMRDADGGDVWPDVLPVPDQREILREVRLPIRTLPIGRPFQVGPGTPNETWTRVRFDPIVRSAGRALLVTMASDGGADPGTRVTTLARFPRRYDGGELYVNAFRSNGTLLVRLTREETNAAAVRLAIAGGLSRQPFLAGTPIVPGTLLVACGILVLAVVRILLKTG